MHQFTDNSGRTWDIDVNVGTARKVQDRLSVNVFKLFDEDGPKLSGDPILLCDTLYVLCADQCNARGVDSYSFGCGLIGQALADGYEALMKAVADFFPPLKAERLRRTLSKAMNLGDTIEAAMMKATNDIQISGSHDATKSQAS